MDIAVKDLPLPRQHNTNDLKMVAVPNFEDAVIDKVAFHNIVDASIENVAVNNIVDATIKEIELYRPTTICSSRLTVPNKLGRMCHLEECKKIVDGDEIKDLGRNNDNLTESISSYTFLSHSHVDPTEKMRVVGHAKAGSGCAISRKYKMFYIHNLKSGGSAIKSFLRKALCPETNEKVEQPRHGRRLREQRPRRHFGSVRGEGKKGGRRSSAKRFLCSNGNDVLEIVNCDVGLREARWKKFLVWSFVRNPYTRIYSAYSMALNMLNVRVKKDDYSFREFALNPRERKHMSNTSPSHYLPQMKFLCTASGCPVFDFIGRVEQMDRDMKLLFDEIEKRSEYDNVTGDLLPSSSMLRRHFNLNMNGTLTRENSHGYNNKKKLDDSNNPCKIGNFACGSIEASYMDKEVLSSVQEAFSLDFELFGYDTNDIPGVSISA